MMKKLKNRKGFTLAELLIVVAIIAVLVAISIPVFTTQLEKSREATDLANIRAGYAEMMANVLSEETTNLHAGTDYTITVTGTGDARVYTVTIPANQMRADWQSANVDTVAGVAVANTGTGTLQAATSGSNWTITYTVATDALVFAPLN